MADVTVIAPVSIQGNDAKPVARAKSILNGFGVMNTTNRDLIHADVKAGGYVVYNTTTSQLEYWNGSSWIGIGASGGGGGMGFRFTYSATTTDADPGAGTFRGNNATLSSVTTLYVDLAEYGGTDITAWLDSFDDTNGGVKGVLRMQSLADPTKWIEYVVTAWTTASGYRKLTVAFLAGPGGLSTTAGDTFLSFDALGYTGTIATANIADDAVTYAKIQNVSAASRVLLRGSAGGAGDVEEGTCSNGVTISGTAIQLNSVLSPLATAGTGLQLARMNAGATAAEWFTEPTLPEGTALTNANVTKNISDGSSFTLAASVLATSAKTFTMGTTGTPEVDELVYIAVFAQTQDYAIANGGPLANTVYTVVTGTKRLVALRWDGANWAPAGKWRLN